LDRVDPSNGAYITTCGDYAHLMETRAVQGRLSGLMLSVKDLIDTAGVRTTYGSRRFEDHVPTRSAAIVERLESDGAILVGKTNLDEFGNGVTGHNPHFGTMRIPGRPDRTPSGSSGGAAAAVLEGSCDIAVGTDSGGSIRLPAACCDLVGFKAAWGSMSMIGVQPLAVTFDSLGFITRDLGTLALVLRLGAVPGPEQIVHRNLDDLSLPPFPIEDFLSIFTEEVWREHGRDYSRSPDLFGPHMRSQLAAPRTDTRESRVRVALWGSEFRRQAFGVDVIVAPVLAASPPTVAEALADHENGTNLISGRYLSTTCWVNALGWAAVTVPTAAGPIQLVARPGHEAHLVGLATKLMRPSENPEQTTDL
jgi:aspartyl-tRNA(Asn)/glutamyl-tRNA(Gln) amidotransferase subunit A